jgi:hypothetical protein
MSAIWESANWTRQFGIRQTGNRQFGMLPARYSQMFIFSLFMVFGNLAMLKIINNLADKISVSAYINLKLCPFSFFVYVSFINHECLYC